MFQFDQIQNSTALGPLALLLGTWTSPIGWNVVSLPFQSSQPNAFKFNLLIFDYRETITFKEIGATPNRGTGGIQYTNGVQYEQVITRNSDNAVVHKENGQWLITSNPAGSYPISRSSTIPHGDVLLAQGNARTFSGPPTFSPFSILPVNAEDLGSAYVQPYYANSSIPFSPENMNSYLQQQIANQTILYTTQISVSTTNQGGVLNIPFIAQNANVNVFSCDFYIETVQDSDGNTFLQLQYTQNSSMNFLDDPTTGDLIIWPHGNIDTLVKKQE